MKGYIGANRGKMNMKFTEVDFNTEAVTSWSVVAH